MKQIINRKLYDTDQAEQIARHAPNTDRQDFYFLIETLYKTSDGDYFIHGEGGPQTKYAKSTGNGRTGSEQIRLLSEEEAVDWCEDKAITSAVIIDEFEHLIEA